MNKQRSSTTLIGVLFFFTFLTYGNVDKPESTSDGFYELKTIAEFKITKNRGPILLPVTFIEKDLLFILDTGSSLTVYDTSLRHELGKVKRIEKALTHGGLIKTEIFDAPDAFLGPLNLKDSNEVSCLDLKMLSLIEGRKISGIIGLNFLKRYVIQIDFDQGTLLFLEPLGEQHPEWGIELPLRYDTKGWPQIIGNIPDGANVFLHKRSDFLLIYIPNNEEIKITGVFEPVKIDLLYFVQTDIIQVSLIKDPDPRIVIISDQGQ